MPSSQITTTCGGRQGGGVQVGRPPRQRAAGFRTAARVVLRACLPAPLRRRRSWEQTGGAPLTGREGGGAHRNVGAPRVEGHLGQGCCCCCCWSGRWGGGGRRAGGRERQREGHQAWTSDHGVFVGDVLEPQRRPDAWKRSEQRAAGRAPLGWRRASPAASSRFFKHWEASEGRGQASRRTC